MEFCHGAHTYVFMGVLLIGDSCCICGLLLPEWLRRPSCKVLSHDSFPFWLTSEYTSWLVFLNVVSSYILSLHFHRRLISMSIHADLPLFLTLIPWKIFDLNYDYQTSFQIPVSMHIHTSAWHYEDYCHRYVTMWHGAAQTLFKLTSSHLRISTTGQFK